MNKLVKYFLVATVCLLILQGLVSLLGYGPNLLDRLGYGPNLLDRHRPMDNEVTRTLCVCGHTLLVVIYNHAHYDNVAWLDRLYRPYFSQVVHYGPVENETLGVRHYGDGLHGWHQQTTVTKAFRENPGYHGYMWTGDDVIINIRRVFGRLGELGCGNVWLHTPLSKESLARLPNATWLWDKWASPSFPNNSADLAKHWRHHLPARFKARQRMENGSEVMYGTFSDIGYIPGEFMADFALLADLFPLMVFEIFIPTAVRLLSTDPHRVRDLHGIFPPNGCHQMDPYALTDCFRPSQHDFVHPVKLSNPQTKQFFPKFVSRLFPARLQANTC